MIIKKVSISHFRSIKKAEFEILPILGIVGENNAGKTSLLRALNCFFHFRDEVKNFESGDHLYSNRSIPRIEITFNDLPSSNKVISKYSDNSKLILEMRYDKASGYREMRYKKNSRYTNLSYSKSKDLMKNIGRYLNYVFIPVNRDNVQFQWEDESILQTLVKKHLRKTTFKRDNFSKNLNRLPVI